MGIAITGGNLFFRQLLAITGEILYLMDFIASSSQNAPLTDDGLENDHPIMTNHWGKTLQNPGQPLSQPPSQPPSRRD
jgi:hypothetical protein